MKNSLRRATGNQKVKSENTETPETKIQRTGSQRTKSQQTKPLGSKSGKAISQTLKAVLGVRELVFSGDVPPGQRLSEITLSEKLALSRTPVRAALSRLEQEGLLEAIPSGGYAVRAFSEADVTDSIELRGVLEGTAARMAAERGVSPARMAKLHALMAELDDLVTPSGGEFDFQGYMELNAAFHEQLKTLSGSEVISREIDRVTQLPFAGPSAFLEVQNEIPEFRASLVMGQAQHRAIVNAIEMREGARAEALSREHARLARQNLHYLMDHHKHSAKVPGLSLVSG
jgi:GntR family transcriptional regulator of vanillate catabolism